MKYCEEYAALLDLYIDGELSPAEALRVQAHLDGCPACQSYVDDAFAIRAAFPDAEDTPVPEGFTEGVMSAIQAGAARQKVQRSPRRRALLSLAACWAIFMLLHSLPASTEETEIVMQMNASTAESAAYSVEPQEATAEAEETETALETTAETTAGTDTASDWDVLEDSFQPSTQTETQDSGTAADYAYSVMENTEEKAAAGAYNDPRLYLTTEEAGDLLANYAPIVETETEIHYQLTEEEYQTLLNALSEEVRRDAAVSNQGGALIIVEKPGS